DTCVSIFRSIPPEEAFDEFKFTHAGLGANWRLALGPMRFDFQRSHLGRDLVEHTVDKFVRILGAEFFGERYGFVDNDFVGYVYAVLQLVASHAQQRLGDGVEFAEGAVDHVGCKKGFQLGEVFGYAVEQVVEVIDVGVFHVVVGAKFGFDDIEAGTGHLPLVEGLHGVVAGHTAGGGGGAFG